MGRLVEENTFTIIEGIEVSSGVLLVHCLSSDLLGDHVSNDTHHGSTTVVDLSIQLAGLLSGVKDVSSEVSNSVVTIVLRCRPPGDLHESNKGKDLCKSSVGNREDSINSGGNVGELQVVGRRDVSVENNVVVVDDASDDGSHGNTSVLALDSSATFESLGLGLDPTKRIKDTKRLGGTDLKLIDIQRSGGL